MNSSPATVRREPPLDSLSLPGAFAPTDSALLAGGIFCLEPSRGSSAPRISVGRSGSRSASSHCSVWDPSFPLRSWTSETCSSVSLPTKIPRASTSSSTSSPVVPCCS
ncbi:protein of unknown function [Agreia sp. COWG]|nr:protein of unknown function [Agreia sp. COWG]